MTEYQRDVYEQVIEKEWMSENAFIMAWNDFNRLYEGSLSDDIPDFIEWLFRE